MLNRDVRLFLVTSAVIGFTVFGGITPVLLNLYLLRLGYGLEFIGMVNAALPLAVMIFSLPAGILGQHWSVRRMMVAGLAMIGLGCGLLPLGELLPGKLAGRMDSGELWDRRAGDGSVSG